ncbi:MAG: hypothetical protein HGA45_39615 [Chloroflexales bacterium]|nr:hypothetical protein [Chloroflexales bacterium]
MHTTQTTAPTTASTNELRARGAMALILWDRSFVILGVDDSGTLTIEEYHRGQALESWRLVAMHEL